jgi:hypothetical protein
MADLGVADGWWLTMLNPSIAGESQQPSADTYKHGQQQHINLPSGNAGQSPSSLSCMATGAASGLEQLPVTETNPSKHMIAASGGDR